MTQAIITLFNFSLSQNHAKCFSMCHWLLSTPKARLRSFLSYFYANVNIFIFPSYGYEHDLTNITYFGYISSPRWYPNLYSFSFTTYSKSWASSYRMSLNIRDTPRKFRSIFDPSYERMNGKMIDCLNYCF